LVPASLKPMVHMLALLATVLLNPGCLGAAAPLSCACEGFEDDEQALGFDSAAIADTEA